MILDAIRVADTWGELFPAAGDSGDGSEEGGEPIGPTPTPTISLSSATSTIGSTNLIFVTNYGTVSSSYQVGDQMEGLYGFLSEDDFSIGLDPAVASANVPIVPVVLAVSEWEANKEAYLGKLIRVNNVDFTTAETHFAQYHLYTFQQGTLMAAVGLLGTALKNVVIPTSTVDFVDISLSRTTLLLAPRSAADIVAKQATHLEISATNSIYVAEGALHLQSATETYLEVFTVAGQSILTDTFAAGTHTITLDAGVYLVKANGAVQKLIVR